MMEAENIIPKLPEGWKWTRVHEISKRIRDGTHNPPSRVEQGIPLLSARNIKDGYIDWDEDYSYISKDDFIEISRNNPVEKYDLLLTIVGTIGRSCVNKTDSIFTVQRSVAIISIFRDYINPYYLQYVFNSNIFKKILAEKSKGTAQKGVYLNTLKNLPIPLAPLPEQHRIVARIEELFSRLDAGVAALQRAKVQLRRYRQAVLKAAVEGRFTQEWRRAHPEVEPAEKLLARISEERRCFWENSELAKISAKGERQKKNKYKEPKVPNLIDLPELPESWDWATVDQLSAVERNSITDGPFGSNLKTSHYTSNGPRVIRLQNIGKGEFKDEKAHISEDHFKKLKKYAVYPGDIVIAALGNPAPRACLIPEWIGDAIVKADCIRLKVVEGKISPLYVMYSLNSFPTQKRTEEVIHGVGRPRLNLGEIKNIVVPLPPIEEQEIIAEEIERSLSIADKVNDSIEVNVKRSELLRQSILKLAFEGKLVSQDPNDESASVLLKKILEEDLRKKIELKPFKRVDIKKITMTKERLSLYDVLSDTGTQLTPEELFKKANFDEESIDEFYQELRENVNKFRIIQKRPNEVEVYLKVVENENK